MPKPGAKPQVMAEKKPEKANEVSTNPEPEAKPQKKEDGTNLFRDVFGDDMDTFIK
jgi:hypothetical protein